MAHDLDLGDDASRVLGLLDLTDLGEQVTSGAVHSLCRRAITPYGNVAAVCLWPEWVRTAKGDLGGAAVRVATVTNFPSGAESTADVEAATERALTDGADEIDVVLRYRDVIDGRLHEASEALGSIRRVVPVDGHHVLKVILETGELAADEMIRTAAQLAVDAGADFIKTSTGKTASSASLAATAIMLDVIAASGRHVGLKPSGGIRTLSDAKMYLAQADELMGPQWVSPSTYRFGASGLLEALLVELGHSAGDGDNAVVDHDEAGY